MSLPLKKYTDRPTELEFLYSLRNPLSEIPYSVKQFKGIIDVSKDGIAFFDIKSELGGVDACPVIGDLIKLQVKSSESNNPNQQDFLFTAGNKLIILESEFPIDDVNEILELGTSLSIVNSGGYWTGSYTFTNTNDFNYLYLAFDFRYSVSTSGSPISLDGNNRTYDVVCNVSQSIGGRDFYVSGSRPYRVVAYNDNEIIYDTGFIGQNSQSN